LKTNAAHITEVSMKIASFKLGRNMPENKRTNNTVQQFGIVSFWICQLSWPTAF